MKDLMKFYWRLDKMGFPTTFVLSLLLVTVFSMLFIGLDGSKLDSAHNLRSYYSWAEVSQSSLDSPLSIMMGTVFASAMYFFALRASFLFGIFRQYQIRMLPVSMKDKFLSRLLVFGLSFIVYLTGMLVADYLLIPSILFCIHGVWFPGTMINWLVWYLATYYLLILWQFTLFILLGILIRPGFVLIISALLINLSSGYVKAIAMQLCNMDNRQIAAILLVGTILNLLLMWYFFNTRRDVNYITLQKN